MGMREPKHSGRLVGSRDNTKHMELHWEGVRVGSGLALWPGIFPLELERSFRPRFPPPPPSALALDMSCLTPLVPHFPSCREGQQPVRIPIGKGLRKGLVILTWNNADHPLSCLRGPGASSLPFLLPSAAESTGLPCKQIVLLCSGGSCTSGRLIWERHQL